MMSLDSRKEKKPTKRSNGAQKNPPQLLKMTSSAAFRCGFWKSPLRGRMTPALRLLRCPAASHQAALRRRNSASEPRGLEVQSF